MKEEKITCNHCGRDLTTTTNSIDYRLSLTSDRIQPRSSCCTDMMIYPIIEEDAHFCSLVCLKNWIIEMEIMS